MESFEFSFPALANRVPDEASAYKLLEDLRWGQDAEKQTCPHCEALGLHYYIRPLNGTDRKTRTGSNSQRRVWKCRACRKQFSVLTGTIFHGTKISIRTWLFVIFELCSSKNGVAAREIERKYGLTAKSAWFMLHRIREAMKREPLVGMLAGVVVADETFIGGKPKNKHQQGKGRQPVGPGSRGGTGKGPAYGKTVVLSLISKDTGEVRSRVVNDVTAPTLRKAIEEQVNLADTTLHTDAHMSYRKLGESAQGHEWVDHSHGEYVRGQVSTNKLENYFGQLKRSIDGTHHQVSSVHLERYLAEFDYRYSTRELSDTARMRRLIGQTEGRRLSYRPLMGG
jgi:transposase-like protein